jgi:hypothetical protein
MTSAFCIVHWHYCRLPLNQFKHTPFQLQCQMENSYAFKSLSGIIQISNSTRFPYASVRPNYRPILYNKLSAAVKHMSGMDNGGMFSQ